MITWHPHTDIPTEPETAVIAIRTGEVPPVNVDAFMLGELYRFDVRYQGWFGETSGLLLRHKEFCWTPESGILATIV